MTNIASTNNTDLTCRPSSLEEIFFEHRGNVSDKWEQYLQIYDLVLAPRVAQGRPLRLLEIGVQNGGSLQIWAKYLPPGSSIFGLDIDPSCAQLDLGSDILILIGDASSPLEVERLFGQETFDIIIDDGSHRSDHIISTFKSMFSRLNLNGIYIIEDLHASYIADFGGGFKHPDAAVEWLKWFADAINIDYLHPESANVLSSAIGMDVRSVGRQLKRVSWFDSVTVIEKMIALREAPFRRVVSGTAANVSGIEKFLKELPSTQLRSLILSPSTIDAFGTIVVGELANANERIGNAMQRHALLEDQIAALNEVLKVHKADTALESGVERVKLEAIGDAFSRVKTQLESSRQQSQNTSQTFQHLQHQIDLAMAKEDASALRAQIAETQLQRVVNSTTWKVSSRIGQLAKWLPLGVRTTIRRVAKIAWWTGTGQVVAKIRARRQIIAISTPFSEIAPSTLTQTSQCGAYVVDSYAQWCHTNTPRATELALQSRISRSFSEQPVFSILVPVFNTPTDVFQSMVLSVLKQSYENWELCLAIVDTGSQAIELIEVAKGFAKSDQRVKIKILESNLGISGNSNAALETVSGDWVTLLDHDDELSSNALFELARAINSNKDAILIYSDKDMLSRDGTQRFNPLFKTAWSPDTMLNANYLTHICAMPTSRIREIGGWDSHTDGAQDWDLFLRAIGTNGKVVHIPKVLYHWRVIETSVSSGGLDVKPYAAEGQLRTLLKYLPIAGWPKSIPTFQNGHIRISWRDFTSCPILILICGGEIENDHLAAAADLNAVIQLVQDDNIYLRIDEAIKRSAAEIVVLLDGCYSLSTSSSVRELVAPLSNSAISITSGRVFSTRGELIEYGILFDNGIAYPAFRGEPPHYYLPGGSTNWYRNASASSGAAMAFRKSDWKTLSGFESFLNAGRPDIAFSLSIVNIGKRRLLLNPFATFRTDKIGSIFERQGDQNIKSELIRQLLPHGDPYVNVEWDIRRRPGAPSLPNLAVLPEIPIGHDFAAEARYVSTHFDATSNQIDLSISSCKGFRGAMLKRMAWFIPSFSVAFYGGIYTILRSAEFMRLNHGVQPVFVVLGNAHPNETKALVRLAFPQLAENAEFFGMTDPRSSLPNLGDLDAAIATLWTTAFPLLRLTSARRKFYFVQDWEPLFYPAGTISAVVEATYRFGFHAICNTPSLAVGYRELGGSADYFMPSVDTTVFNDRNRPRRSAQSPFVLVSYARPGASRNCFEALVEAFKRLKEVYGDMLEIVTAGQAWNPELYGLEEIIINLGLLSYQETGALYRSADAGLVAMATRHPSYLPFELMACGAVVITNRNPMTTWLLRDEENCLLCEMTKSDIVDKVSRLIDDKALKESLTQAAKIDICRTHSDWDSTCEKIYEVVSAECERDF